MTPCQNPPFTYSLWFSTAAWSATKKANASKSVNQSSLAASVIHRLYICVIHKARNSVILPAYEVWLRKSRRKEVLIEMAKSRPRKYHHVKGQTNGGKRIPPHVRRMPCKKGK